jgi:hypothetical protein
MGFLHTIDGNMKFRFSLIIIDPQIDPKNIKFAPKMRLRGELLWVPFNPTLCQNVKVFHQNIDRNMKLRFNVIIIDPQIDQKTHQICTNNEFEYFCP